MFENWIYLKLCAYCVFILHIFLQAYENDIVIPLPELLIKAFWSIVPDISKFGLHSLRAGDATVCENSGESDKLFKRHGRWRSESAKDSFIRDMLDSRLLVLLRLVNRFICIMFSL